MVEDCLNMQRSPPSFVFSSGRGVSSNKESSSDIRHAENNLFSNVSSVRLQCRRALCSEVLMFILIGRDEGRETRSICSTSSELADSIIF